MAKTKKRKKASPRRTTAKPIRPGDFVQCVFREQGGGDTERMWVIVTSVRGSRITGTLDSAPVLLGAIRYRDTISFPRSAVTTHWPAKQAGALAKRAQARYA